MKSSDLPWMIQFIAMFYNDKPGDWLLEEFLKTKICHLEKDFVSKLFFRRRAIKINYFFKPCNVITVLKRCKNKP